MGCIRGAVAATFIPDLKSNTFFIEDFGRDAVTL